MPRRRANRNNDNLQQGPSKPANVTDNQEEWHAVSSDDEESYANEMKELYKD